MFLEITMVYYLHEKAKEENQDELFCIVIIKITVTPSVFFMEATNKASNHKFISVLYVKNRVHINKKYI